MRDLRARVTLGVVVAWVVVAIVWGAQNSLAANLQGSPVPVTSAVRTTLVQSLPWIPGTLVVLFLAARFPVTRATWRRNLPLHAAAVPLVALLVNTLVVLGFWTLQGSFDGFGALLRGGARWAAIRIHVVALLYAALAAGTHAVLYYRDERARELRLARLEGQLTRARLDALSAQIRPHFLFNTLHTIGQLWRSDRQDEADAMLDHLGALFHRVQETSGRTAVLLEEELEMVEDYLAIERVRFRDRLRTAVRVSPEAAACTVPPLLLQPVVENAVRHGISARSAAGLVEIDARVQAGELIITIGDDGPGFAADARRPPSGGSPRRGTGLRNTRERLAELYGEGATLETGERPGGGGVVRIRMGATTAGAATAMSFSGVGPRG